MPTYAHVIRVGALALTGVVLLVVASVGAVAYVAELHQTWQWYFRMEEAIRAATPVVAGLAGVALAAFLGLVAFSLRD